MVINQDPQYQEYQEYQDYSEQLLSINKLSKCKTEKNLIFNDLL